MAHHPPQSRRRETILVVDDDDDVRAASAQALRANGYHVVEAASGEQALITVERDEVQPDLLFTDIVMPGMDGQELARRLQALRPSVRVLFTTGYLADVAVHGEGNGVLAKPFTPTTLITRVRKALRPPAKR